MTFRSDKRLRLDTWNYSAGGYYHVVFCTKDKACTLGEIINGGPVEGAMFIASRYGEALEQTIADANELYGDISVEKYAIMPNHVHLLVYIGISSDEKEASRSLLSRFVGYIKSQSTKKIRESAPAAKVWQARFYEHVIRGEDDYQATWKYIDDNPAKWMDDEYYVQ